MVSIQTTDTIVPLRSYRSFGKHIHPTSNQISQRMATQGVTAQQKHIHAKDKRPDTYTEIRDLPVTIGIKKETAIGVVRQDEQENDREIQEVPVNVLKN